MHIKGCTAFVTGAAQGLGKAFSRFLLQGGARVCLSDVQAVKGKEVEKEFQSIYGQSNVVFLDCDVASKNSFSSAFQKAVSIFGNIDLLVNNAGIANESKGDQMISINLNGVIYGTMMAIEHMRKDNGGKGGTIINVASTAGLTPAYFSPVYAASKYGVVGFTKSWASNPHLSEMGIQLACLCPSFADTSIIDFQEGVSLHTEEALNVIQMIGVQPVENVVKGFNELMDKENCNGDVCIVTAKYGVKFQRQKKSLL